METLYEDLSKIVGANNFLNDTSSLTEYGRDWTRYYTPTPQAVVFPQTTEQVVKIVHWARNNKIPLVPSGGRTGLSGAAVAKNNEVVVSFAKMNKVLDFNQTEMIITVEPGVITEVLQNYVADKGYYFPVDFAARGSSQIGGNVATINNTGTVRKTGGAGATTVDFVFNNISPGRLEVLSGTLNLGNGSSTSEFNAAAGATINFILFSPGTYTIDSGASITGAGAYRVAGAMLNVNSPLTVFGSF